MNIQEEPFGTFEGRPVELYTLDNGNGVVVKVTTYGGTVTSIVTPDKDGNAADIVCGFDPTTGEELWTCIGVDDYIVPAPIAVDGVCYLVGGRKNRAMAIRVGGRGDVSETHKLWEENIGANVTSPLYYQGHLYWSSDKGIANCMDAETGESVYRERMPTTARVYASMVRGGERLYATTRDKGVLVLPAKPEYKQLALNALQSDGDLFNATPAITDSQILLRSDSWLFCIGEEK